MHYLFYTNDKENYHSNASDFRKDYRLVEWRPGFRGFVPPDCGILPFGVWWLFHLSRLFYNRDYSVLLVYHKDTVVHRSCVFPGYFRFPFMSRRDLQVGDTYTDPRYRGRGIAVQGLNHVARRYGGEDRLVWYVVSEDNHASIRVAEKAGFRLTGIGSRRSRLGVRIIGYYRMERQYNPCATDFKHSPVATVGGLRKSE